MEAVGPADVALCVLLRSFLCPDDESDPPPEPPLHAAFGEALLQQIRRRDETYNPTLIQLLQHVQDHVRAAGSEPGKAAAYFGAIKDGMARRLAALDVPNDLVTLFGSLAESAITQSTSAPAEAEGQGADANSAAGLYLRLCYARYTSMSFEALCKLLEQVQAYYDAGAAEYDAVAAPRAPPSRKQLPDLDRHLSAQLASLDRRLGSQPQAALEGPLAALQAAAPQLPRVHLARHASSLHHRDFSAALEHLHRYFDTVDGHTAAAVGPVAPPAAPATGQQQEGGGAAGRVPGRLQAAALSLAAMHARLGHMEEALQALNETVRIAQQSSDDACLAHALALLCSVLEATTPGTITSVSHVPGASPAARHHSQLGQLLRRCLRRSEELQLPHLAAFSRLALARFELLHPRQPAPAPAAGAGEAAGAAAAAGGGQPCGAAVAVAGALRDVAHLHLAAGLAAAAPSAPPLSSGTSAARVLRGVGDLFTPTSAVFSPALQGMQASSAAEVEQLAAGSHLLQAACWELRGSRQLAQAHSLACLDAFGDVASAEQQCTALAQLATSAAAAQGYHAAERLLAAADARFPHAQSRVLAAARLAIAHDRALRRRELHAAADIAARMAALASPTDTTDIGLRLEAEERAARTLLAAGRTEEAAAAAHKLAAMASATGQPLHSVRLLLLLARVHRQAGAPLNALPYALSAANHARLLHADPLAAEASVLMAGLWCDMGARHAARARLELEAALPAILAHGSLELQAAAQAALAEALMSGQGGPDGLRAHADWVLGLLGEAQRISMLLEDRRAAAHSAYLQALVHDALGDARQRDAAAASFAALSQPLTADA